MATNQDSLEAQAQRLRIDEDTKDDDDAFLEEAIKLADTEKKELKAEEKIAAKLLMAENCMHGRDDPPGSDCVGFITSFLDECEVRLFKPA